MNRHDGQFPFGKLGWQLLGLFSRLAGGENLEAEVARSTLGSSVLALRNLTEGSVGEDLTATCSWHLGDGGKAVRDVGKLQSTGRRQVARQHSGDVANIVTHGGEHGDAPMLQLRLAAAAVILGVSIRREASRLTEANWCLDAELVHEPAQRRSSVQGPVTTGKTSEAILDEPADDSHNGQSFVSKLG